MAIDYDMCRRFECKWVRHQKSHKGGRKIWECILSTNNRKKGLLASLHGHELDPLWTKDGIPTDCPFLLEYMMYLEKDE